MLIDKDPQVSSNLLDMLNERELITKANEALEKMMVWESQESNGVKKIGAKRLCNGGIVYEFDSPKTTTWMHNKRTALAASFGGTSVVKDKAAMVLIEYIPTSYNPDAIAENRKIKHDSKIKEDTLLTMRWIKPAQSRAPGQHVAHIIARFKTTTAENQAIHNRLVIAGKRVWARWLWKEPRRCLKCQVLNANHLAARCMHADTCSTCGGEHRMADCIESDQGKFHCINCNQAGHASWDHLCPRFVDKCRRAERTDLEHTYVLPMAGGLELGAGGQG